MTDQHVLTRLSEFLAVVLRHNPQAFGLSPDGEGYMPLARADRRGSAWR